MAKERKKATSKRKSGKAEGEGAAGAAALPQGTREVISASKLTRLMAQARSTSKDIGSLNGTLREKIGYAKENDHLNTAVFSLIRRLDRMEPEKLATYLEDLEHYLDISGLNERAASAPRMAFGPGTDEEEDEGDKPASSVTPFPKPTSVAAE